MGHCVGPTCEERLSRFCKSGSALNCNTNCVLSLSVALLSVVQFTMGQFHQRRRHQFSHHQHCTLLHSPPMSNSTLPVGFTTYLWLLVLVFIACSGTLCTVAEGKALTDMTSSVEHPQVFKRSAPDGTIAASDYPDYQPGVRYDEYPVIVPKRTALLLDRIMAALQKAVEDEKGGPKFTPDPAENKMDLQRRGQEKGRVYWRCYFNAVTCFKRK